jgi:hypothetical protein
MSIARFISVLLAVTLGGCATLSPDGGFGAVDAGAKERGLRQEAKWLRNEEEAAQARESVEKLLAAPLTADGAVQIALLNNRGLQGRSACTGGSAC